MEWPSGHLLGSLWGSPGLLMGCLLVVRGDVLVCAPSCAGMRDCAILAMLCQGGWPSGARLVSASSSLGVLAISGIIAGFCRTGVLCVGELCSRGVLREFAILPGLNGSLGLSRWVRVHRGFNGHWGSSAGVMLELAS